MVKYIHNDGTVVNSFEEAVDYWKENCFDCDFEEFTGEIEN